MQTNNIKIIYNGKIKLKFVDNNHSYWIAKKIKNEWGNYERIIGTTGIISIKDKSMPLKYWVAKIMAKFLTAILEERQINEYDIEEAKKLHTKRLEEASTIGSKIHDWIEKYINGEKPEMPSENNVVLGVNAFLDWVKKHKVKFLQSEIPLYSKRYDYCGTADAIAIIDKKKVLIDYKTSTGLYNDVMMQTASYAQAYEEMTKDKLSGRWAIRLEKRSEEEFKKDMDEKGNPNAEYIPFEAIYLDYDKDDMADDFSAFLSAQNLKNWDKRSAIKLENYKNI